MNSNKHLVFIPLVILALTGYYTYFGQMVPQKEVHPPKTVDVTASMGTTEMVDAGKAIFEGKGTCTACHKLSGGTGRFPDLGNVGASAGSRIAGMSAVDYLAESLYRPNKFIVPGFNPGMPNINESPIGLSDLEIKAVIAYLQTLGSTPTITMATALKYETSNKKKSAPEEAASGVAYAADPAPTTGEEDLEFMPAKLSEPVDIKKVAQSSPALVEKGKGLYGTFCISCHGPNGDGNGPAGAVLNPKPRNFTSLDGWTRGPKFSQMFQTLQEGIPAKGMPPFDYLPVDQRFALIHFVRTFNPKFPPFPAAELSELDQKYHLSKGQGFPGQIPVAFAMKRIADDGKTAEGSEPKKETAAAPATSSTGNAGGGSAEGKALFTQYLCNTCHQIDNAGKLVGPSLYDVGKRLSKDKIKESIMEPDKVTAEGFPPGLMSATMKATGFYQKATPEQVNQLVEFLAGHKGK